MSHRTLLPASCSARRISLPGCLRKRLGIPPLLSWRNIGACRSLDEHAPRRVDLEVRCIGLLPASQYRRSASEPPAVGRCEARDTVAATTLLSSRPDLAVFKGLHALGTSMCRCGFAGRSFPSHSPPRSPAMRRVRGSRRDQVAPIPTQARVGRTLWACCGVTVGAVLVGQL